MRPIIILSCVIFLYDPVISSLVGHNITTLHVGPFYEGWNFNSGNYLFTTDTK